VRVRYPLCGCEVLVHRLGKVTKRGLSFERVAELEWDTAVIAEDTRRDYGEPRLLVGARLCRLL
jgi:uncharacterized DUF497 family protein